MFTERRFVLSKVFSYHCNLIIKIKNMKLLKLSIFLLLGLFVLSCSSDDGATTSGDLIGKWYFKEYKVQGQTILYDDHEECGKDYIQFNVDGTGANVDVYNCVEDVAPYTYTRSGNNITVISDGTADTVQITELSSTTFKFKTRYDFDDDGDEESVIIVFTKN